MILLINNLNFVDIPGWSVPETTAPLMEHSVAGVTLGKNPR